MDFGALQSARSRRRERAALGPVRKPSYRKNPFFWIILVIRFIENPPRDRYHYHPQYSLHLYRYVKVERV